MSCSMVVQEGNRSRVTISNPALAITFLTETDILIFINRSKIYKPTYIPATTLAWARQANLK